MFGLLTEVKFSFYNYLSNGIQTGCGQPEKNVYHVYPCGTTGFIADELVELKGILPPHIRSKE